ncbi:ATP-binding cassette domain-containing protein, partial [Lichenihabitans sp. Uapishka_5]|uniref:amino acid ABC transporter ATP-binding/permease protein n=1 Tax=Lichenihabitans sp. Uapishka_5 TaxID=3037302 RepID=UPI0029E7D0E3
AGLEAVGKGILGGPMLVGLVLAVLASFEAAAVMVRNAGRFGAALAAAERLAAIASTAPAVAEPATPQSLPPGSDLTFSAVSFSHRPERPLLRGLTLHCPAGSRVAIVGESGCGKSTLLDLALRLADPAEGLVRVAGADVSSVAQADLHARVALMSQTTPVFLGTVGDNLRLGRPDADDAALWRALDQARLRSFVEGLPDGLHTWCGEGGRTLSAGQARRICLARTLLSPAAILLLDEPTSGLDQETERAFLHDLACATAGRTVVLVTHAALPPGTADRVFRLTNGRLERIG